MTYLPSTKMTSINKLPKGLILAHINICSLRNKIQDLSLFLQLNKIDILMISETHLDHFIDNSDVDIGGFSIYRNDRNRFGGGVAIYIRDHFPVKLRHDLMFDDVEVLWLQVQLPHLKPIILGCCYRPPSARIEYVNGLCNMLDKVTEENRELYWLGDLNIDWLSDICPLKNKLKTMTDTCGLSQLMDQPTRISSNNTRSLTSKCIDHIYTNNPDMCSTPVSVTVGFSDHNCIAVSRRTKLPKACPKIIMKRSYRAFNEESFLNELDNIKWNLISDIDDVDASLNLFMDCFMRVVNNHAPLKKFTVKAKSAPWVDTELRSLMAQREEAKKVAVLSDSFEDRKCYCILRNQVTKVNRVKKKKYFQKRIDDSGTDCKRMWNVLNEIMGKKSTCTSFVELNGVYLTKPIQIANYFNDYFVNKVSNFRETMKYTVDSNSNELIERCIMKDKLCSFEFHQVNVVQVEMLLRSLTVGGSVGTDNLDSRLLKLSAGHISKPICHIFNRCLIDGECPKLWKEGKIIPLPKDTKSTFCGPNSRPISILPILSKLLEKIVFKQVQDYFSNNDLTTMFQHAYRYGHSTCTAMTQMSDSWLTSIDNSMLVGTLLLDFSAAFDVIDHEILISKLISYGFTSSAIKWFKSYLSERSQRVYFNGALSCSKSLDCGVPQGSCLGPLLFSIFTNDMPYILSKATLTMFADDTTLYYAAPTCSELNQVLSCEISKLYNWIKTNKLVLNISKTMSIIFGSKYRLSDNPKINIQVNGQNIQQVKKVKLLGLWLDSTLSWSDHINTVVAKMGRAVAVVRKCAQFLNSQLFSRVVCTLVLCHLDYCSVVWSAASSSHLKKLQVAQNKAARLVLGCSSRTSVAEMHERLAWLMVKHRLSVNMLVYLHRIINIRTPKFFYDNIIYYSDMHLHYTRGANSRQISLPLPKSDSMKRTVFYRSIVFWNNLPVGVREIKGKTGFKKRLRLYLLSTS